MWTGLVYSTESVAAGSRAGRGGVLLRVVFVVVAFVGIVNVFACMMLVPIALMDVVDVARLVPVMFVPVAFMDVVDVLAGVVFVLVALVDLVLRINHSLHLLTPEICDC